MTHEECFTFHAAREIRSYRDLPQIWYHIQTKERDEPRPKSGILRTREFMMKDSYSFDRDDDGLDASYDRHIEVYKRIFDRCGLEYWMVESDVGMMGGLRRARVHGAQPGRRGRGRALLELRLRRQPRGGALGAARAGVPGAAWTRRRRSRRRASTTIEGLAEFLGIDAAATAKAMVVVPRTARSCWRWCAATTGCTS